MHPKVMGVWMGQCNSVSMMGLRAGMVLKGWPRGLEREKQVGKPLLSKRMAKRSNLGWHCHNVYAEVSCCSLVGEV